jgi:hypothetical protein
MSAAAVENANSNNENAISAEDIIVFDKIPFILKKGFDTVNESGDVCRYLHPLSKMHKIKALKHFLYRMLLVDAQMADAPPGIYTWLIKRDNETNSDRFYASEVQTKQEIGSLHLMLHFLSKCLLREDGEIIAAGELQVLDDRTISFNLQSGTYYEKFAYKPQEDAIGKKRKFAVEKTKKEMNALVKRVSDKIRACGIPQVDYIGVKTLIDDKEFITNARRKEFYNKYFAKEERRQGGTRNMRKTRKLRKTRKTRK